MDVGINQDPTIAVTMTANNVAQYSAGIAGGSSLKFAVKLQNFVMLIVDSGLSGIICKKSKTGSKKYGGDTTFIKRVEFPFKFSCQLTNSKP